MEKAYCIIFLVLTLLMIRRIEVQARPQKFVNVFNYGAKGDGITDDSQAFLNAWKDVCHTSTETELIIPRRGNFLLKPINFQGPCSSNSITIQMLGTILGPNSPEAYKGFPLTNWIQFIQVNGLKINGQDVGKINGNGPAWWKLCEHGVTFNRCNNLQLHNFNFFDSPEHFIRIESCDVVDISHVNIQAPKDSPNTDGINLNGASRVYIHDSTIGVGDDCIAMDNHAHDINITRVSCGPGHGISIGSLGFDSVEQVHVSDCKFFGTLSGVKIKTWQGGAGFARSISYEKIEMNNVQYPIMIDQYYCPNKTCRLNETSAIKINDITYKNIFGTSATEAAIVFNCSHVFGCNNIQIDQINLTSALPGKSAKTETINAHGNVGKFVIPYTKLN